MDSLEKLFVSCLVLFGLFILFLFGLYFDLGDMVTASLSRGELAATSIGHTHDLISEMEWRARPREILPTALGSSHPRGGEVFDGAEMERSVLKANRRTPGTITGKDMVAWKRKQLVRAGVASEALLDMEALAEDRDEYRRVMAEVDRLTADRRPAEAARVLAEAVGQHDPKNVIVLKDYLTRLVQLHLEARQVEKAKEVSRRLYESLDKILAIRHTTAGEGVEKSAVEEEIASLNDQKQRLDQTYQDLERRTRETGTPLGLTSVEKGQIRDAVTRAYREGKLPEDEYRKTLKELES
jgi:hypothetical protein